MSAASFDTPDGLLHGMLSELQASGKHASRKVFGKDINMVKVIREFYSETSSPQGRSRFVRYVVIFLGRDLPADTVCQNPTVIEYEHEWGKLRRNLGQSFKSKEKLLKCLARFGEHLILRSIYPVMTRPGQSTPSAGLSQNESTADLREDCLRRDGNKCVVTGAFNLDELAVRAAGGFRDDDGRSLYHYGDKFRALEVASIIPHALGWSDDSEDTSAQYRVNVLNVLDMFRPGTMCWYQGQDIDCPENAITLESGILPAFGRLELYFDPVHGSQTEYTVRRVDEALPGISALYPRSVTFRTTVSDVPLPDPNLLAIHRACARIAHVTGVREACLKSFQHLDDGRVAADGSTPLANFVAHRLWYGRKSTS